MELRAREWSTRWGGAEKTIIGFARLAGQHGSDRSGGIEKRSGRCQTRAEAEELTALRANKRETCMAEVLHLRG